MTKQKGTSGSALYFPSIELPSRGWAYAQLLLWDSVQRIVPETVAPKNEDIEALVDADLITDIPPADYTDDAERYLKETLCLSAPSGKQLKDEIDVRTAVAETMATIRDPRSMHIHKEKLSKGTKEMLRSLGVREPEDAASWWIAERKLGYLYMCCLAYAISQRAHAPLVTDFADAVGWQLSFRHSGPKDKTSILRTLTDLNIAWPAPEVLEDIPTKTFLEWRKSTTAARQNFRATLLKIHAQTVGIKDQNEYRATLKSSESGLAYQVGQFRQALDELGVKTFTGAVRMSWPSGIAAAGTALATVVPIVGVPLAILGVGWSAVEARAVYREGYRKAVESNPYSYIALLADKYAK
jgi:hypothetical protein